MARRSVAVAPPGREAWLVLLAAWLLLMAVAYALPHAQSPANPVPWWLVVPFATALPIVAPLAWLGRRSIVIEDGTLVVSAGMNTLRSSIAELQLDKVRVLNLQEHVDHAPMLQLFGMGLPGFKAGHYLLRNRRRAFCLLTDRQRVVLIPRRDGRLLLLSPERPQALLDALRDVAATSTGHQAVSPALAVRHPN